MSAIEVPAGVSEEAALQYRELQERFQSQCAELHQIKSEKIIADNTVSQLKYSVDSEREKLAATELVNTPRYIYPNSGTRQAN